MSREKGGFDLSFSIAGIGTDCKLDLIANIDATSGSTVSGTVIRLGKDDDGYYIAALNDSGNLWERFYFSDLAPYEIRYCMHDEFMSFYANNTWVHTIHFHNIDYPDYEDLELSMLSSGSSITVTNLIITDLCDWREAIFIDLDTVAANAISSIIQQRPVEIRPTHLGEVRFQYSNDDKRDSVALYKALVKTASRKKDSSNVISDAIVYGSEVEILTRPESAARHGFITKIIRVPELDTGARRAAIEMMKQLEQQSTMYTLIVRSDLRIEIGDILTCSFNLSGTLTLISISCIVEDITVTMHNGVFEMTITGRNYES